MQKHYIRLVLRPSKKNALGQAPVYLRMTVEGSTTYRSTGYYIHPNLWDKKGERVKEEHPMAAEMNTDITDKKRQVLSELVQAGVKGKKVTARQIKARTVPGADCLFRFAEDYGRELEQNNKRADGTLDNYEKHMRKLREYHGEGALPFDAVTLDYLNAFETWLRTEGVDRQLRKGRDGSNYIVAIMKTVRRMFKQANKRELTENYPFEHYEFPEYTPDEKEYLTLEELDRWTECYRGLKARGQRQVALYFLFGCYTGLRISDWYAFDRKKHLVGEEYIRLRAKKNGEWVVMPVHRRLRYVLEEMKTLPLTTGEKSLVAMMLYVSKKAGINKHLSSHCARKTFAITMCADRDISLEVCAELMGITLEVCRDNYYVVTPYKIKNEVEKAWTDL